VGVLRFRSTAGRLRRGEGSDVHANMRSTVIGVAGPRQADPLALFRDASPERLRRLRRRALAASNRCRPEAAGPFPRPFVSRRREWCRKLRSLPPSGGDDDVRAVPAARSAIARPIPACPRDESVFPVQRAIANPSVDVAGCLS